MIAVVIVGILAVALFFLFKSISRNNSRNQNSHVTNTPNVDFASVYSSIKTQLTIVQEFQCHPDWKNETSLVMIIPTNENGQLYAPDSDRLRISVLLLRDNLNIINFCLKEQPIANSFNLVHNNGAFELVSEIVIGKCNFKTLIPAIDSYLHSQFPTIPTICDGSRIRIRCMCQDSEYF